MEEVITKGMVYVTVDMGILFSTSNKKQYA